MPRTKINPSIEQLVLRYKRRARQLGVRGLADFLNKKHNLNISKSAIHKILQAKGIGSTKGRKSAFEPLRQRGVKPCGLILLQAIDYQIGLFDYLAEELRSYFPELEDAYLRKLIVLASFSHLIGADSLAGIRHTGLLRLIGLRSLPRRRINYFRARLFEAKPRVSLIPLRDSLKTVLGLKFFFADNTLGYCDARMSSFWDKPAGIADFSLPLKAAKLRLKKMLSWGLLTVGYTKSFYYLSPTTFNFLKGLAKGLKRVEFLGVNAEILGQIEVNSQNLDIAFSYSPRNISKKAVFLSHSEKFHSFSRPELGDLLYAKENKKISQPTTDEDVTLINVLIKERAEGSGCLGILTTVRPKVNVRQILKKYLYFWPYMGEDFPAEMRIIGKAGKSTNKPEAGLKLFLPKSLIFTQPADFVRVAQILSVAFKDLIWGWEPKGKKGDFWLGREYVIVALKNTPEEVKKAFNKAALYIGKNRVFLL